MANQDTPEANQNTPDQSNEERDRREQRMMWIFSGTIVLLILGAMGANMLFHHDVANPSDTNISAQARTAR